MIICLSGFNKMFWRFQHFWTINTTSVPYWKWLSTTNSRTRFLPVAEWVIRMGPDVSSQCNFQILSVSYDLKLFISYFSRSNPAQLGIMMERQIPLYDFKNKSIKIDTTRQTIYLSAIFVRVNEYNGNKW